MERVLRAHIYTVGLCNILLSVLTTGTIKSTV